LSVVDVVLSDYIDGWKMLGCYYMQLGYPKTSEADCSLNSGLPLSGCLMHCWYAGVDEIPSFIAASLSYCKSVVGYLVAGESSPRITLGCVGRMFAEVGCCSLLKLASLFGLCVAIVCMLDVFWHLGAVFVSPLRLLGLKKLTTICGSPIAMYIVVGCF
ncbi:hypothetical protein H0E87_010672, partial [Populus deltoides]